MEPSFISVSNSLTNYHFLSSVHLVIDPDFWLLTAPMCIQSGAGSLMYRFEWLASGQKYCHPIMLKT